MSNSLIHWSFGHMLLKTFFNILIEIISIYHYQSLPLLTIFVIESHAIKEIDKILL